MSEDNLWCIECGWVGDYSQLVAATDDLDDEDFIYCPDCGGTEFEESEEGF